MPDETTPAGMNAGNDETVSADAAPPSEEIRSVAQPTEPATPSAGTESAFTTVDETEVTETPSDIAEPTTADDALREEAVSSVAPPGAPTEIIEETGRASTRSPLVPILAATTAVFFIAAVLFGLMAFAPRIAPIKSGPAKLAARAQEEDGIKQIARRFAENFVSLSYDSIDDDLDRMTADATSNFATKLRDTVNAISPAFKKAKASSTGEALDAAILSHTDDSAIVQVLIRRTKTNVGTKKGPETGNQIVNVTLVKTSDGWKASDLSQLGAEQG